MKNTGRYEIRKVLGEGGMGVVYRAWDPVMKREVTVKTIRNHQDKTALEMFKREIAVLGGMGGHPNIVEVYDVGETDDADGKRPYFVMPLLRGTTLDQLIKASSTRLTPERGVQIIAQACKGIQAAHELGLIHRDIKPSNIFVLEDDSVKVIDFGVAHLMDQQTATGLKGTARYMAPEQLLMKAPTPLSDQFSVAVVCYELLANRHPFAVTGYSDLTQAILNHTPVGICDLNPSVSRLISQVVHRALAKEPVHRFSSVRDFSDTLQKALRNEEIPMFDQSKIEPRLDTARKALAAGDLDLAADKIRELEAESCLHPEIGTLRHTIDTTKRRKQVQQLLETGRKRFEAEEYPLALQKVQEAIDLEPDNTDAFTLKAAIENKRSLAQVDGSLRLAQQHLDNHAYDLARQSADKVLQLRPKDPRAMALLAEAERREVESARLRQEKEKAYSLAIEAHQRGDLSAALSKLERVIDLERTRPDVASPDQSVQKLYDAVKTKHDWLDAQQAEAKRHVNDGNLPAALAICEKVLQEYPSNVIFHSLKYDVEELSREQISAYIAKVEKAVAAEPDLNRKVSILEEAKDKYPLEDRFRQSLERAKSRRDLVQGIAGRAVVLESGGQFGEALTQWETLRTTYPQYPGLEIEIERLRARREQQKLTEAKAAWVAQIDRELVLNSFAKAESLATDALAEYPDDAELLALKKSAQMGARRIEDAKQKLAEGLEQLKAGKQEEGFAALREASKLDPQSHAARNALMDGMLEQARGLLDTDRKSAEPLVAEALEIDPSNPLAKSLRTLIADKNAADEVATARAKARELQQQGDFREAIREVDETLEKYPQNDGLAQLRSSLVNSLGDAERAELRAQDLAKASSLAERSESISDAEELRLNAARTRIYRDAYSNDLEFLDQHTRIERRVKDTEIVPAPAGAEPVSDETVTLQQPAKQAKAPGNENGIAGLVAFVRGSKAAQAWIALGMAVVIIWILTRHRTPPAPPPPQLVRIVLDHPDYEHVTDTRGNDLTAQAQDKGISPGNYCLLGDAFSNFKTFGCQQFEVKLIPGKVYARGEAPTQNVDAVWPQLATALDIQHGDMDSRGQWSLDESPLTNEQLANVEVKEGAHELDFAMSDSRKIRLQFSVEKGYPSNVDLKADSGIKAATGVAVGVTREGAHFTPLNAGVRWGEPKHDVDLTTDVVPWDSSVSAPLETKNGTPLGTVPARDVTKQGGLVYVYLILPADPVQKQNKREEGGRGFSAQSAVVPPPRINDFSCDPPSVKHGEQATLRWSVADATIVTIDGQSADPQGGTRQVRASELRDYSFTIRATNSAGRSEERTTKLSVTESRNDINCREGNALCKH